MIDRFFRLFSKPVPREIASDAPIPLGVGSSLVTHEDMQPENVAMIKTANILALDICISACLLDLNDICERAQKVHDKLAAAGALTEASYLRTHITGFVNTALVEAVATNRTSPLRRVRVAIEDISI